MNALIGAPITSIDHDHELMEMSGHPDLGNRFNGSRHSYTEILPQVMRCGLLSVMVLCDRLRSVSKRTCPSCKSSQTNQTLLTKLPLSGQSLSGKVAVAA